MKFVQARYYTKGPRSGPIDVIVVHTMEAPEKPTTAEAVANWFAGPTSPKASAHYCIDNNSVVQSVRDRDIAWHAPGANHNGLGFEHAGTAAQTKKQWLDPYSVELLMRSARLAADKVVEHKIPIRHLSPAELRAGKRGFVGHLDVTRAYPDKGTHTDPGAAFPWSRYLRYVRAYKAGRTPIPVLPSER